MSRNSLCQWVLLQRPWLVSLGYAINVPQVSLAKMIQAGEGDQASQGDLKPNIVQRWPPLSSIQLDCFFLHNFTSLHSSTGPCCHHHHLQRHPYTRPLLDVPLSFYAVSPDSELPPLFPGLLFKALLEPGWHLYLCMEIRQNETVKLMLWEQVLKRWKLLGDAQML